ncbi:galactose mutarotase [Pediococcus inopinatus]|uniref:aldose epimerase family protein n=1 Tax=Pediococcus inopinatus TaxID=114090 RepID=UPI002B25A133|nr:aldose epimerase family protein [Pediococcus inopinatus]WPC16615.1 galactose mutarotase [Pediococcus inopinatus]
MTVNLKKYQFTKNKSYYEIEMKNTNGMIVKLLNYGATLEKVLLPTIEGERNVILSLDTPEDYSKKRNFLGGTVGRFVGRVKGHTWNHGNVSVSLPANEGNNCTHGGNDGLDRQVFDFSYCEKSDSDEVSFILIDPDGHNGFPGNLKIKVKYVLDKNDKITYTVEGITDEMTLFNPTNHVYFALEGKNTSSKDTVLSINSKYYKPLNTEHLPIDSWHKSEGTVFDLRCGSTLERIFNSQCPQIISEGGLNHPFLLSNGAQKAAAISSGKVRMVMKTSAPAIVAYTANHFKGNGITHNIHQHSGIALEGQIAPTSDLDWSAITLLPNEVYTLKTSWKFEY